MFIVYRIVQYINIIKVSIYKNILNTHMIYGINWIVNLHFKK